MKLFKTAWEIKSKSSKMAAMGCWTPKAKVFKNPQELWGQGGKSIHLTGTEPRQATNRIMADRYEQGANSSENDAWNAYRLGDLKGFEVLMDQAKMYRDKANWYRRVTWGGY